MSPMTSAKSPAVTVLDISSKDGRPSPDRELPLHLRCELAGLRPSRGVACGGSYATYRSLLAAKEGEACEPLAERVGDRVCDVGGSNGLRGRGDVCVTKESRKSGSCESFRIYHQAPYR